MLSLFLAELFVAYRLRPNDRYKAKAVASCLLIVTLLGVRMTTDVRQTIVLQWAALNVTLIASAAAHACVDGRQRVHRKHCVEKLSDQGNLAC